MKVKIGNRSTHITFSSVLFVLVALALAALASSCTQGQTQSTSTAQSSGAIAAPPVETAAPTVALSTPTPTPSAPPAAPSDLAAKVVAVFDVLVGWQDKSNNEDGFRIYRQRVDAKGDRSEVGTVGANTTSFTDPNTQCGETYHYTVASYNKLGESPVTVCWSITEPACPGASSLSLKPGADQGFNFLTKAVGANGDFYLANSIGGTPSFMADQNGQRGLLDLGDVGDTPLVHVQLPSPADYVKTGVPAVGGHTYAALANDGVAVIVFKVESLDGGASLSYIVWKPGQTITGTCQASGCKGVDYYSNGRVSYNATQCGGTGECGCRKPNSTLACPDGTYADFNPQCTGGKPCVPSRTRKCP